MVAATSFPYFVNFASAPAGSRYTWILPPYPEDSFAYMAWSQQAAHGALLFKVKYTALPQSPFLFHPLFLICGWASRLLHCNLGVVHFAVKEIGVVLFFLVFYKYLDYLGLTALQSAVAMVLVSISSGLGGPLAWLGWYGKTPNLPADLWMPEVSTYWSLLWNPLFPYSLLLMVLAIYYLDRGTREERKADLWRAGLAAGVLALVHPYSQPLLLAFAVVVIAARRRMAGLGYLLRYLIALAPFAGYIFLLSILQPVVAQHSSQGTMDTPPIGWCLTAFAPPLLMWAAGSWIEGGRWMKRYWQVVLWFVLSLSLAYFPFWFQRKLIFGAHIPVCILAAVSCGLLWERFADQKAARWLLASAAVVLLPILLATPIYVLSILNKEVQRDPATYYISNDMENGLKFLKQHTQPDEIVLATLPTSRIIPAFAGNTVLWGHWAMSVDSKARNDWSYDLMDRPQEWKDESRARKFWGAGIEYIFADGILKQGIADYPWQWGVILKHADEVFHNGSVVIYKHREGP